jgi:hypothetical protein
MAFLDPFGTLGPADRRNHRSRHDGDDPHRHLGRHRAATLTRQPADVSNSPINIQIVAPVADFGLRIRHEVGIRQITRECDFPTREMGALSTGDAAGSSGPGPGDPFERVYERRGSEWKRRQNLQWHFRRASAPPGHGDAVKCIGKHVRRGEERRMIAVDRDHRIAGQRRVRRSLRSDRQDAIIGAFDIGARQAAPAIRRAIGSHARQNNRDRLVPARLEEGHRPPWNAP